MALSSRHKTTIADFEAFVNLPENADARFELINGEIIDVPSNPLASVIAMRIVGFIFMFLQKGKADGHVSGEGGGFIIDGQVFAPDVAYMRDLPTNKGFENQPPLLAVEVISDPNNGNEQIDLRRKLAHYRNAGVVAWVVDYIARKVEVHLPDNTVSLYDDTMTIPGGDVLPGFELPVKDIFPNPNPQKKDA
jgi:Uma2 family endonuclease